MMNNERKKVEEGQEKNLTRQDNNKLVLYSYWRSSASWRVRIALALKQIDYEYRTVNLKSGEQQGEEYKKLNPAGLLPALIIPNYDEKHSDLVITQSLAIIDYLESIKSTGGVSLMPSDPLLRAHVLELVCTFACDTHPLQNLRTLGTYPEANRPARAKEVITEGLRVFETLLTKSGKYCVMDNLTLADVVLVPQVYNALRWDVDLPQFPKTKAIYETLNKLPAFIAAHPDQQPDCPDRSK